MNKSLLLLAALLISGCATTKQIEIQTVDKAVLGCPAPPILKRPDLPISTISESDTDGAIAIKYKATIYLLMDYAKQQEAIIELYKNLPPPQKPADPIPAQK